MGKLFKHAPVDAAVDQLGKRLMYDALPPALEVAYFLKRILIFSFRFYTETLKNIQIRKFLISSLFSAVEI